MELGGRELFWLSINESVSSNCLLIILEFRNIVFLVGYFIREIIYCDFVWRIIKECLIRGFSLFLG